MGVSTQPVVSFVLATHNRCAVVTHTLEQVARCGLDRSDFEVIVVDNASGDGTPDAVAEQVNTLLQLRRNAGSCAKAYGVEQARGRYVVFLDDDSYPQGGSIARMIERFEEDPRLAAAGFSVHLPDGRREGSALPGVFVGCGVGFRAEALRAVGGLDRTFFMQAEEYDLSFRLATAGWTVAVFDDLHVTHLKAAQARQSSRTTYYDVRNNLRLVARYLPAPCDRIYRAEWLLRYAWLAERDEHMAAFVRGVCAGALRGLIERRTYRSRRLPPVVLERFFGWEYVHRRMARLAESGVRRVILADVGKNVFAFYQAARRADVSIRAIGDDRFCAPQRRYRGIPIVPLDEALSENIDAVVVSNSSAVHAAETVRRVTGRTSQPVHSWFDQPGADYGEPRASARAGSARAEALGPCSAEPVYTAAV